MSIPSLQCLIGVCKTGRSRFVQRASERLPFSFGFVYPLGFVYPCKSNSCPQDLSPKCPRVWFNCPLYGWCLANPVGGMSCSCMQTPAPLAHRDPCRKGRRSHASQRMALPSDHFICAVPKFSCQKGSSHSLPWSPVMLGRGRPIYTAAAPRLKKARRLSHFPGQDFPKWGN